MEEGLLIECDVNFSDRNGLRWSNQRGAASGTFRRVDQVRTLQERENSTHHNGMNAQSSGEFSRRLRATCELNQNLYS